MNIYKQTREYVCEPMLASYAAAARNIVFDDLHEPPGDLRNVTVFRDKKTWRVRFFLGGKQRTLGMANRCAAACRFADAARLFFWQYRVRDCRPPRDADFNYDLASAEADLASNVSLVQLMTGIRDYLVKLGALAVADAASEAGKAFVKRQRESRRTLRFELAEFLSGQVAEAGQLQKSFAALGVKTDGSFSQLKEAFHHILERLEKIEAKLP